VPRGSGAENTKETHYLQSAATTKENPYSKAASDAEAYPNPQTHMETTTLTAIA